MYRSPQKHGHTSASPSGEGCRTWRQYLAPKKLDSGRVEMKAESESRNEKVSGFTVLLVTQERCQHR